MVKVLCIVQARLTSTRLPNKVLMELGGTGLSLLEHTYLRLEAVPSIDKVVFAIPDTEPNDKLALFLSSKKIEFFRGSEDNVLKRFYDCAIQYKPEMVVRATCDNPCVDYEEADKLVTSLTGYDYAVTTHAPLGTAVEVFTAEALYKTYKEATGEAEYEHVTPYIYRNEELFKVKRIPYSNIPSFKLRLTVDTEQDMDLMNQLYSVLYHGEVFPNQAIYNYLSAHKDLLTLNAEVHQKTI